MALTEALRALIEHEPECMGICEGTDCPVAKARDALAEYAPLSGKDGE